MGTHIQQILRILLLGERQQGQATPHKLFSLLVESVDCVEVQRSIEHVEILRAVLRRPRTSPLVRRHENGVTASQAWRGWRPELPSAYSEQARTGHHWYAAGW
eukprot:scaffold387_cov244-Pinguiococcus_pyrenoidosus.AAC.17